MNYFLFQKKFSTDDSAINPVNDYFADLDKSYFSEVLKNLEKRNKCIELKGDYIEK